MQNNGSDKLVFFDFDGTLVSGDCLTRFCIKRLNFVSCFILLCMLPFSVLAVNRWFRARLISFAMVLVTWKLSGRDIVNTLYTFGGSISEGNDKLHVYQPVLEKLQEHINLGHQVVIISASNRQIIKAVLGQKIAARCKIFTSHFQPSPYGLLLTRHNFRSEKLAIFNELGKKGTWIAGYTDSENDLGLLVHCTEKHLVNPSRHFQNKTRRQSDNAIHIIHCE